APDARAPAFAVVLAVFLDAVAGSEHELRRDDASGRTVADQDRVARVEAGQGAGLVDPRVARARDAVVELHAVHLGARDEEDAAGARVHGQRRLARAGGEP